MNKIWYRAIALLVMIISLAGCATGGHEQAKSQPVESVVSAASLKDALNDTQYGFVLAD